MEKKQAPVGPDPEETILPETPPAPAAPPPDEDEGDERDLTGQPTLRELRRRGIHYKGGGVTTGTGDVLLPARDVPGYATWAYIGKNQRKDLIRVFATGWYEFGPEPDPEATP